MYGKSFFLKVLESKLQNVSMENMSKFKLIKIQYKQKVSASETTTWRRIDDAKPPLGLYVAQQEWSE